MPFFIGTAMLTRLEAHGFKNLLDFSIDFGPFNCIAGLNGVGKSNIFDLIRFLSLLCDNQITTAATLIRDDQLNPDPADIFYTDGIDRLNKMKIAAEMIVELEVVDDFGRPAEATSSYLRYELELGYDAPTETFEQARVYIISESLVHRKKSDAIEQLKFPLSAGKFRDIIVVNNRKGASFVSTNSESEQQIINVHQDSGSRGQPSQKFLAHRAIKTVIGNTNSSTLPTILAARREMQSWRFLALEPSSMRRSNRMHEPKSITQSGDYLASTLFKLYQANNSIYEKITSNLSEIIPVQDIRVEPDLARQIFTLEVKERAGAFLPARALSDGTLRFLTLCIMSEDPEFKGLLCFEEPENGIHPAKIHSMLELIKDLAVDPFSTPGPENPMRQLIVATHSPLLVQLTDPADIIFSDVVKVKNPFGRTTSTIRCFHLSNTWRVQSSSNTIGIGSILSYLAKPKDAQLSLECLEGDDYAC